MALIVTVTRIDLNDVDKLEEQRLYARKAVHHGLIHKEHFEQGNSPFNGDLIYSQMFNTQDKTEKQIFDKISSAWKHDAKEAHVYLDLGFNEDMLKNISELSEHGLQIKFKTLSDKNMVKRAVDSLKDVTEAVQFFESQKEVLQHYTYKLDYHFSPKNEVFESRNFNPQHNENGEFKRIILESPFAGDVNNNVHYAKALIHKLAHQGYAPSASHLLYTQCLNDTLQFDRDLGINKGLDYAHNKDSIIGIDRGFSTGMKYGVQRAINEGRSYRFETLSEEPSVIKSVSNLRDITDAVDYIAEMKDTNTKLFENTGFINPNSLSDKLLLDKNIEVKVTSHSHLKIK